MPPATWWNRNTARAYLPDKPRAYTSKVKNAQEAHEAIRPAGHPFRLPESLRRELENDEFRLFEMIWKRTIASQMVDAQGHRTTITIEGDGAVFQVSGKTIDFPGFLRAYVEGSDDPNAELADKETVLPAVRRDEPLTCRQLDCKGHTTQPPARFSEASLTRTLEEMGIGRPSTYAAIIDTILARDYVFKKSNSLVPTWVAFSVVRLLTEHLPNLVDYQFTAQMEDLLDEISRHEKQHVEYLQQFFFGDERAGLEGAGRRQDQGNRCARREPVLDRHAARWPGPGGDHSCGWASTARFSNRGNGGRASPTDWRRTS